MRARVRRFFRTIGDWLKFPLWLLLFLVLLMLLTWLIWSVVFAFTDAQQLVNEGLEFTKEFLIEIASWPWMPANITSWLLEKCSELPVKINVTGSPNDDDLLNIVWWTWVQLLWWMWVLVLTITLILAIFAALFDFIFGGPARATNTVTTTTTTTATTATAAAAPVGAAPAGAAPVAATPTNVTNITNMAPTNEADVWKRLTTMGCAPFSILAIVMVIARSIDLLQPRIHNIINPETPMEEPSILFGSWGGFGSQIALIAGLIALVLIAAQAIKASVWVAGNANGGAGAWSVSAFAAWLITFAVLILILVYLAWLILRNLGIG